MTTTEDMDPSSLKDGSMIYLGIYVTISGLMFSSSVHVAVKRRWWENLVAGFVTVTMLYPGRILGNGVTVWDFLFQFGQREDI